jgi:hypothetical protein
MDSRIVYSNLHDMQYSCLDANSAPLSKSRISLYHCFVMASIDRIVCWVSIAAKQQLLGSNEYRDLVE